MADTNQNDPPLSNEETLELLLDDWEDAIDRGSDPVPEIICKDYPHLLEEFVTKTKLIARAEGNLGRAENSFGSSKSRRKIEPPPSEKINWKSDIEQLTYHAHGGLGIVFRGFDMKLHRDVAVKFIRERRRHNPLDVQRFRVEAEITSRLDHPGVAPVHGYGVTENGVPFYAMRMVEGRTLQQRIEQFHSNLKKDPPTGEQSLEFRQLLSSFISVCHTIEYAHSRGILNCDIKPGNIMLGRYGETVVLDWGCAKYIGSAGKAKVVGEESLRPLSDTGDSKPSVSTGGTPIYMSPEQHAQSEDLDPKSDIYCLGVTLYRLITGQPAFSPDQSLPKIREMVIRGKFRKPTNLCPWISKALEAICLKAMSLSPEDRYENAAELARDLERYLADEQVTAYPEPFSRRLARLMRRHRGVSQVLMVSAMAILLISFASALVMRNLALKEIRAREQAHLMQDRSLQLAARSAATSMALKVNDAWRILEIESNAESLRKGILQNQISAESDLQKWLAEKADKHDQATHAASWFVCNSKGVQIARYPYYKQPEKKIAFKSIGENYSHRDYFTGFGYDLEPGENHSTKHISDIHLSAVYQSSNTADLKVAFSIPIWSENEKDKGQRKFLGILGYSVELGQFAVLQDEKESASYQQRSILVDLRRGDRLPGKSQFGLILQHPKLKKLLASQSPPIDALPRLPETMLKEIEQYRTKRVKQIYRKGFAASSSDVLLLHQVHDPFDTTEFSLVTAACEPVCVVGRSGNDFDIGWLVIVEEISSSLPHSSEQAE